MEDLVFNFIESYGLIAVFALMISNGFIGAPPSEVIMGLAGVAIFLGHMNMSLVILAGVLGNILGTTIVYYIGLKIGYKWLLDFKVYLRSFKGIRQKISDWLPSQAFIDKFSQIFTTKEGFIYVGVFRCFPVIRSIISLPAGIVKMPVNRFLIYSILGCTVWISGWVGLGYALGESWYQWNQGITIILLIILIVVIFYLKDRLKKFLEI